MTSVNPYKFILQVCLVLAAKGSPSQRRRGGGGQNKKNNEKGYIIAANFAFVSETIIFCNCLVFESKGCPQMFNHR